MYSAYLIFGILISFTFIHVEGRRYVFNHHCTKYFLDTEFSETFHAAVEYCHKKGMELLYIENKAQADVINFELKKIAEGAPLRVWTSGTLLGNGKDWMWLSTGEKIEYFNWGNGEPNPPENTKCLQLGINAYSNGGLMGDIDCDHKRYTICQVYI